MCEGSKLYPAFGKQVSNWSFYKRNKGRPFKPNLITFILKFEKIDVHAAKLAFEALIRGHESLRTTFTQTAEGVMQVVSPYKKELFDLEIIYCKDRTSYDQKRKICNARAEKMLKELETGPLFTGILYEIAKDGYFLEILIHHIIADAWSAQLIEDELLAAYQSVKSNHPVKINMVNAQLKDYALEYHAKNAEYKAKEYWVKKLENLPPSVDWGKLYAAYNSVVNITAPRNIYKPRLSINASNIGKVLAWGYGHSFSTFVEGKTTEKINQLSVQYKTTPSIIVLMSFLLLIRFLFDTDQTLIISRLNGRFDPLSHKIIGNFTCATYTIIESGKIAEQEAFIDILFKDFLDSIEHAVYNPLILSTVPLTANCHLCVNILYDGNSNVNDSYNTINKIPVPTYFPIENIVRFYKNSIAFNWIYNTSLFRSSIIQFISAEHLKILNKMVTEASDIQ